MIVSDCRTRYKTKMTGHSQGNFLGIVRINLFNLFIPDNKVTLAASSLVISANHVINTIFLRFGETELID